MKVVPKVDPVVANYNEWKVFYSNDKICSNFKRQLFETSSYSHLVTFALNDPKTDR